MSDTPPTPTAPPCVAGPTTVRIQKIQDKTKEIEAQTAAINARTIQTEEAIKAKVAIEARKVLSEAFKVIMKNEVPKSESDEEKTD